jgi:radical SAM protein with 4Fe4S-binding SPASM domain
MACPLIPDVPADEFRREIIGKWMANHIPLSGTLELDLECNLKCTHCYRDGQWPRGVLETDRVIEILNQIAEAGTIWLLFTGGEIFLRRDFFEIYEHAIRLGLKIVLFTNGTTITERVTDRLAHRPPYAIEVSLYGYTQAIYEKVTGIPGSRHKCYQGVELLLDRGLPIRLKTVLMRANKNELTEMLRYAEERGVPFKWDSMINPHLNGSMAPCKNRLSPEEVVELDFAIPSKLQQFRDYFEPRKDFSSDRVFSCGAGSRSFHIDPYGRMSMCLLAREPSFSLRERSFQEIWEKCFPPIYTQKRNPVHPCNQCNLISLCGHCPGWSQMEKGDPEARVEYCCEVGHRRAQRLGYLYGRDGAFIESVGETMGTSDDELIELSIVSSVGGIR